MVRMSRSMDMRRRKGDYWMMRSGYEDRKILRKIGHLARYQSECKAFKDADINSLPYMMKSLKERVVVIRLFKYLSDRIFFEPR